MRGPNVKIFVFRYVCFVSRIWLDCVQSLFSQSSLEFGTRARPQDLWPFLISETGLEFLIWTQGKIHPGNRASLVNRAHMKRPLVSAADVFSDVTQRFPFEGTLRDIPKTRKYMSPYLICYSPLQRSRRGGGFWNIGVFIIHLAVSITLLRFSRMHKQASLQSSQCLVCPWSISNNASEGSYSGGSASWPGAIS